MSIWSDMQDRGEGVSFKKEDVITKNNLEQKLRLAIIHFAYEKKLKRGQTVPEIREAWGTKKMEIVDSIPHGGSCPPKDVGYTTYFDLEKRGWRVFWNASVVKIEQRYYTMDEIDKLFPDGNVCPVGLPDNSDV